MQTERPGLQVEVLRRGQCGGAREAAAAGMHGRGTTLVGPASRSMAEDDAQMIAVEMEAGTALAEVGADRAVLAGADLGRERRQPQLQSQSLTSTGARIVRGTRRQAAGAGGKHAHRTGLHETGQRGRGRHREIAKQRLCQGGGRTETTLAARRRAWLQWRPGRSTITAEQTTGARASTSLGCTSYWRSAWRQS